MIIDNQWYGHSKILKNYAGIGGEVFYAAVSHCREILQPRTLYKRLRYPGAKICVWSKLEENILHKNGCTQAVAIGAPFLYLNRMQSAEVRLGTKQPTGTICFPVHGVPGASVKNNISKLSEELRKNFEEPITISVPSFDQDFEEKKLTWEREGFRTIYFGRRSDGDYLLKFTEEILNHKVVTSDDMGSTAIQYGLYLGKSVAHWSGRKLIDYVVLDRKHKNIIEEELLYLLSKNQLEGQEAQRAGNIMLGFECLKSQEELTDILGWNSFPKIAVAYLIQAGTLIKYGKSAMQGAADHNLWTPGDIQAIKEYETMLNKINK